MREKCKNWATKAPRDVLIIGILLLASLASFGLGYLAGQDASHDGAVITEELPVVASPDAGPASGQVLASKNGTKYYLPDCSGASRISEANKVWFATAAAAAAAGYAPAANCKGI